MAEQNQKEQTKKEAATLARKLLPLRHQGARIVINITPDGGVSTIEVTTTHR